MVLEFWLRATKFWSLGSVSSARGDGWIIPEVGHVAGARLFRSLSQGHFQHSQHGNDLARRCGKQELTPDKALLPFPTVFLEQGDPWILDP